MKGNNMSLHEKISSLYDDELDGIDPKQLVDSLKKDEQKLIWGRYSMIGEAMRRNLPNNPNHDLFSRVQSAIESEPALLAPSPANVDQAADQAINAGNVVELPTSPPASQAAARSNKPVAGLAVAASIALVSVLGFQMLSQAPVDNFSNAALPIAAVSMPATQSLDISSGSYVAGVDVMSVKDVGVVGDKGAGAENVAFSLADVDEPAGKFDDVIYAQQSLTDDGQWTRITRVGNILLDDNILARPPEFSSNVEFRAGSFPFAGAINLEAVSAE